MSYTLMASSRLHCVRCFINRWSLLLCETPFLVVSVPITSHNFAESNGVIERVVKRYNWSISVSSSNVYKAGSPLN